MKFLNIILITFLTFLAVTSNADWLNGADGYLGPDPVFSGNVEGYMLYVCAANTSYGWQAGHLVDGQTTCNVSWGNSSRGFRNYVILNDTNKYMWVNRNRALNYRPVYLSNQGDRPTGICRNSANRHNGKMIGRPNDGVCVNAWGNGNSTHTNFDVLVYR